MSFWSALLAFIKLLSEMGPGNILIDLEGDLDLFILNLTREGNRFAPGWEQGVLKSGLITRSLFFFFSRFVASSDGGRKEGNGGGGSADVCRI